MEKNITNIVILGVGIVGRVTEMLVSKAHSIWSDRRVYLHDPAKGFFADKNREYHYVIVCTSCPDGELPEGLLEEWDGPHKPCFVVRSTVKPHALFELPIGRRFCWPEFLTERTAWRDAEHPDKIVWGGDDISVTRNVAEILLGRPHPAPAELIIVSLEAAALAKLAINTLYVMKLLTFNAIYDAVRKGTYEQVCQVIEKDQRITLSHHDIWQDGYRGAGGKCLPKDIRLLREIISNDTTAHLLQTAEMINERLLQETGYYKKRGEHNAS